MKWKKWIVRGMLCMFFLGGAFCSRPMKAYAYTEEEKAEVKAWLSANGYAPTMEGAQQAYSDYLAGKFNQTDTDSGGGNETPQPTPTKTPDATQESSVNGQGSQAVDENEKKEQNNQSLTENGQDSQNSNGDGVEKKEQTTTDANEVKDQEPETLKDTKTTQGNQEGTSQENKGMENKKAGSATVEKESMEDSSKGMQDTKENVGKNEDSKKEEKIESSDNQYERTKEIMSILEREGKELLNRYQEETKPESQVLSESEILQMEQESKEAEELRLRSALETKKREELVARNRKIARVILYSVIFVLVFVAGIFIGNRKTNKAV